MIPPPAGALPPVGAIVIRCPHYVGGPATAFWLPPGTIATTPRGETGKLEGPAEDRWFVTCPACAEATGPLVVGGHMRVLAVYPDARGVVYGPVESDETAGRDNNT